MGEKSAHLDRLKYSRSFMQKVTAAVALLIMVVFFSIVSPYFFKVNNLMTIALQTSITAITAYGMIFVIISAGVDLSIGSIIALTGILAAVMLRQGFPIWLTVVLCMALGSMVGMLNGFMISKMKLPPFIATLGSQMALRGLALVVTDARPIYLDNAPQFKVIAQAKLFDTIPLPVIYMAILGLVSTFLLRKTVIGRNVFAVGSNEESARLSGINTAKIRIFAFLYSGLMASIAGLVLTSRVNSGQPTIGVGYEASAIAASVIGGASMRGGHGSISGAILGAFIMGVLMNGLNLLNVSQNWQVFATGFVVIFAVYLDKMRTSKD
jgi:ribose transport system permease protein